MDEKGIVEVEKEMVEASEEEILLREELKNTYLTFWLGEQVYGLSIAYVVQIIGVQKVTEVPNLPYYVKGIISLRGEVMPVIDLRLRLSREEIPHTEQTCIIVMRFEQRSFGIIVDKIEEVIHITEEMRSSPPEVGNPTDHMLEGIANTEGGITLLLNAHLIVGDEELDALYEDNDFEMLEG